MRKILLLICILQSFILLSQNPTNIESKFGPFPGFSNEDIKSIAIQSDGKIIVVGSFQSYKGAIENGIIRLNTDGSKDTTFNTGTGFDASLYAVALQADGKILVGGYFTKFQGANQNGLIRLNSDGSKDTSFNIGTGFIEDKANFPSDATVRSITIQSDGKIIVGGDFIGFQGATENHLIRLNPDGSKDTTFNIGSGFNSTVYTVTLQTDGKILVGGDFSKYQGLVQNYIIRLNPDGSEDTSFRIGMGFDSRVFTITLQNNGKILVAGWFDNYDGKTQDSLIRLNIDGSKDTSFNVFKSNFYPGGVETVAVQSDGKILIGGTFFPSNLLRLNADGSLDSTFAAGTGFGGSNGIHVNSIAIQSDGKILVGGNFAFYQEIMERYFIRINPDGSKDTTFHKGSGFNNKVYTTSLQTDGKILVGGKFTTYLENPQKHLIRFNTDGSKDSSFNIGKGFNDSVYSTAQQSDGKIVVGGLFTTYQDVTQNYLTRLNADGGRDVSFDIKTGFNGNVRGLTIQSDDKIIVNGEFTTYQGSSQNRLIRLNKDGSKDSSFNIGTGFDGSVLAVALQPDGRLIVGGNFKNYQGASQNYLIRLNPDGTKDTSFNIGTGFGSQYTLGTIQTIVLQPDGKILVGGQFKYYQGNSNNYLIRLNSDGSKDTSFNIGTGFDYYIYSIVLQEDGKIIVAGGFVRFQEIYTYDRLARLNSDGSKDLSFNVGALFTLNFLEEFIYSGDYIPAVYSLNLQPDGKLIVGGGFTGYKGDNNSAFLIRLKGEYNETALNATATPTNTSCPDSFDGSASISVSNGKSPYSYLWSNGATTETITGLSTGTYSCKVTDANSATISKSLIVSTNTDTQNPIITAPAAITVNTTSNCSATDVVLGTPVTADNCSVVSVTNNAPTTYPVGNTTVTWTVKDANNNTATATQIVTVKDVTLPTITAPADKIVNAVSDCKAYGVALGTPITADNCTVYSVKNNAPSSYPIGNTTVTWTVTDASNNIATATQIVTVKDITLPTISTLATKAAYTNSNCTATGVVLGTPVTADNCSVASISNDAPTTFPLGITKVTWTVKDTSGNTVTAIQTIVVSDATKPTITAPPTVIINADSNGTATGVILGTPVTADNCSVTSVTNNAPTTFPLGNTSVTWTVKDASNNIATATQIVTVKDATPPTLIPVANFMAATTAVNSNGSINFKDNSTNTPTSWAWEITRSGSTTLTSSLQNPTFTFVDAGTYTVKLTATNGAGSNTKTVTNMITVTPPTLIPLANFTASTTAINTNESINFKDNSTNTPTSWAWEITRTGSTTLTSSLQNPTFTFVDAGTYTVKLTATNGAGSNTKTVTNMITVFISLPSNNFTIESKGESCLNQNNGEINISAKASYNYVANINGTKYPLVNNSLKVSSLAPAVYNVSITITGELFEQNFTVTIPKGATITAKSTVSSRMAAVEITEGTAPYTVFVNGEEQFETASDTFSVGVNKGDFLEIKTAKACERIYLKEIDTDVFESVLAHPNPTSGKFEIEIPISIKEIVIDLYTMDSKIISKETYTPVNGRVLLNLENQASGVYIAKIYLTQPKYLKIIKK
ncbi:HYR domain-containing protein [Flavobacterium undicola]|uniref:HYR domain-containing protein n=1 Tax=Flavobacterium undicola TaxID=1932779 RepID=UPI0013785FFE|nr:PKD domain-containing protein [Flavobacterium undicola]MBA0883383.1 HYR domain-containing protein [Flavobacterium undicola]